MKGGGVYCVQHCCYTHDKQSFTASLCTCYAACREREEEPVFSADLFSASLSSQQRCELAQQKYTPEPEAEPLNFLLQAVKDGEQLQPGDYATADAHHSIDGAYPAVLLLPMLLESCSR
jgi:hypothetical protein